MRTQAFSRFLGIFLLLGALLLVACSSPYNASSSGKLQVVATTTIVADVVRQIGGDNIDLTTLMPVGTDPHAFQPAPQDAAKVANAKLIFANGAGLEAFLQPLLQNAGSQAKVIEVSDGIHLLNSTEIETGRANTGDPHTWFDPNNVIIWTQNIEKSLSAADPQHAAQYAANAKQYQQKLQELDAWIKQQVDQIPVANRQLVTDHAAFTYFANRYGFQQTGAIVPGYSTESQPTAQELARLEDSIRKLGVKAVFVGETVNPSLSEQVAKDTGVQLVYLYTASLTAANGPAPTYIDMMHYDVSKIVEALK